MINISIQLTKNTSIDVYNLSLEGHKYPECWEQCVFGKLITLPWYHKKFKWQYIGQFPKSKLQMHEYTDMNYIDTCIIYKNINFISNSYRRIYNLKDCNEIKN